MDWAHPDYGTKAPWRGNSTNPDPDIDAYTGFMKGQLAGLVEKPAFATILGSGNALEIAGQQDERTVALPADGLDPIAAVVALDFPATPTVKAAE